MMHARTDTSQQDPEAPCELLIVIRPPADTGSDILEVVRISIHPKQAIDTDRQQACWHIVTRVKDLTKALLPVKSILGPCLISCIATKLLSNTLRVVIGCQAFSLEDCSSSD